MKKTVKETAKKTAAKTVKAAEEMVEKTVEAAATMAEEVKEEVKAVKKTAAKKTALKEEVVLQWYGKEVNKDDLMKQVKEIWTKQMKKKVGDMKSVTLYLKPEENMVYYVINGDVTGSIEL